MSNLDKEKMRKIIADEPNMNDKTLLLNVEDLINWSFGTTEINRINFKLLKTVLQILARQMRLLEQEVEIKYVDVEHEKEEDLGSDVSSTSTSSMSESSESEPEEEVIAPPDDTPEKKAQRQLVREQKAAEKQRIKTERAAAKEKERAERHAAKEQEREARRKAKEEGRVETSEEKERRQQEKEAKAAVKERERAEKTAAKEKQKAETGKAKGTDSEKKRIEKEEKKAAAKEIEKAEKAAAKEKEKAERAASKEREREERAASKEREKLDKAAAKEQEKAEQAAAKEREKAEKQAAKEKEKAEKQAAKEKEKAERHATKEKEKAKRAASKEALKDEEKGTQTRQDRQRGKSADARHEKTGQPRKTASGTVISERERPGGKGSKVLVVEKGPTTRGSSGADVRRVGSIEVVTQSQFALLVAEVNKLRAIKEPFPVPAMPDNAKLRQDLAKGRASLTDTMQAMQLSSRVQAAEEALSRMAGMVQHLAGVLPTHLQEQAAKLDADLSDATARMIPAIKAMESGRERTGGGKAVAKDRGGERPPSAGADVVGGAGAADGSGAGARAGGGPGAGGRAGTGAAPGAFSPGYIGGGPTASERARHASTGGRSVSVASTTVVPSGPVAITHPQMEDYILTTKQELTKYINTTTAKTVHHAEMAASTVKAVVDKLDVAMKLEKRINTLYSQTLDYAEQLTGFDSGLSTQMASFQEQMAQMRSELRDGLAQLESANNNAETAAILDLNERYEALMGELDATLHAHQGLGTTQKQINSELRSLVECVEMLREQKADRDEVQDGLRDKADIWRLAGLLHESDFAVARSDLERRIDLCYEKFRKQDRVWLGALKDLTEISEGKAETLSLLALRENAAEALRIIQDTLNELYILLGDPKAAILTRYLSRGGTCGACRVPALMEPTDIAAGKPVRLPAVPREGVLMPPCIPGPRPPTVPDPRDHVCRRWVGGSHTLVMDNVTREKATPPHMHTAPSKRYTGYGVDGRLYMLQEELEPCLECNQLTGDAAGDAPLAIQILPPPDITQDNKGGDQEENKPAMSEQGDSEKIV